MALALATAPARALALALALAQALALALARRRNPVRRPSLPSGAHPGPWAHRPWAHGPRNLWAQNPILGESKISQICQNHIKDVIFQNPDPPEAPAPEIPNCGDQHPKGLGLGRHMGSSFSKDVIITPACDPKQCLFDGIMKNKQCKRNQEGGIREEES